ncbi:tripartite tricarboxylate transporter substrate binding protein [Variovorax rhizosphaerae]|uniref:Tripartite tricarboxylate transporter substrate binding protein n=1 Tax=Variovorax rhizosphaerae TaxID=1836200 RepID=A0ABU8WW60_9BURK
MPHFISRRRALAAAACTLLATPSAFAVNAASWTDKPIRLVVTGPAGGSADVFARLIGEALATETGQTVVVENKPGAGGAIAIKYMLSQPADGLTMVVCASNVLTEVPLVLKGGFDPLKDVKPIAALAKGTSVLVGSPTLPASDVKGLVTYLKGKPGQFAFASYSAGTSSQYAGLMFSKEAGLDLQHVPYPGSPPALVDVIAGRIPIMFDGLTTSRSMIDSGKLKVFAVASKARSPQLPNVPTMTELGYPDLVFGNWMGVIASSKMAPELVQKIHSALAHVGNLPSVKQRLLANGFDPIEDQPVDKLGPAVREEYERNAGIVKTYDIKLN